MASIENVVRYVTLMKDAFVMWLIEELKTRGWSQAEFARRAEVSSATVSRVFSGENNPGDEFIRGTARAFGIPIEAVMRMVGKLPQSGELLPEVREWNERLLAIPADRRQEAVDAMDGMLRALESAHRRPGR